MDISAEAEAKTDAVVGGKPASAGGGAYGDANAATVAILSHCGVFGIIFRFAVYGICGFEAVIIVVVAVMAIVVAFVIAALAFVVIANAAAGVAATLSAASHSKVMAMMLPPRVRYIVLRPTAAIYFSKRTNR